MRVQLPTKNILYLNLVNIKSTSHYNSSPIQKEKQIRTNTLKDSETETILSQKVLDEKMSKTYLGPVDSLKTGKSDFKMPEEIIKIQELQETSNQTLFKEISTPSLNTEIDEMINDMIDRTQISDEAIHHHEHLQRNYYLWITTLLNNLRKAFFNSGNLFEKLFYFDMNSLYSNLYDSSNTKIYISLVLVLIIFLFVYRIFFKNNSAYYKISKSSLSQLYVDRIKFLEEIEQDLRGQLEEISKTVSAQNLLTRISICAEENTNMKTKLSNLQTELMESKKIENHIKSDYIKIIQTQKAEIVNYLTEISEKNNKIEIINNEAYNLKEQLSRLSSEKDTLVISYSETQKYVDSFVSLFLAEPISTDHSLHDTISTLKNLNHQQVLDVLSNISKKLSDYDQIEKESTHVSVLTKELHALKENYEKRDQEIKNLEHELKQAQIKLYEGEVELKTIKKHYKETESSLHEKHVEDFKLEISSLELQIRKMKEDHSIQLNNQYIINKKIERELEKVTQEKETYRNRLLKVLNDNQMVENEKHKEFIIPKFKSNTPSRRSNSPIKSSFYRSNMQSFESDCLPQFSAPPPPPPYAGNCNQNPMYHPYNTEIPDKYPHSNSHKN
ncbi:hypothetical protein HZS_338, partial [Henneguya salminicola]